MVIIYFLFIVVYLFGLILFVLVVGKIGYGIDICEYGSGNLGGINIFCILGKKVGFIVIIVDILKGILVISLLMIFGLDIYLLWFGLVVVFGYVYLIFVKFCGGKVVVIFVGVLLCYLLVVFVILVVVFFIFLFIIRYVLFFFMVIVVVVVIVFIVSGDKIFIIVMCLLVGMVIYKYCVNIG